MRLDTNHREPSESLGVVEDAEVIDGIHAEVCVGATIKSVTGNGFNASDRWAKQYLRHL